MRRHGPPAGFPDPASLFRHASLHDFLEHFGAVTRLLRDPEDLCWLLHRHLAKLRRQRCIYAEVRVSPQVWRRRGLEPRDALALLCRQVDRTPIPFRIIVDGVRQWGREALEEDLDLCLEFRKKGVCALGLGGDEAAAPARSLTDFAAECRSRGVTVLPHAGEGLGPGEVADALEVFAPPRLGHGIHAATSPPVMESLRLSGTHLEVCPTSNRRTGAFRTGLAGAFRRLLSAGLGLSVNTDDPGLFGSTLGGEVRWAARTARLDAPSLGALMAGAARAALLPPSERDALVRALS